MQRSAACALVAMLLLNAVAVEAQVNGPRSRSALARGTTALTNVHVVPMSRETVIRDATVLVRDGRIAALGPSATVQIPAGATRIDGGGRYVIPGLIDTHAHLYADGTLPASVAPAELGVMLANGVTAVRFMAGHPGQLTLRQQVIDGTVTGPQLWVSSPMFANEAGDNTRVITNAADARAAVRDVAAAGYDFVKVTFGIVGDVYDALVDEAKRAGIPVVGHVEPAVGVRRALAAGQQLEHLDAFFEAVLRDDAPMRESLTQFRIYQPQHWASLAYIDDAKVTEIARETARAGAFVAPTLDVFNRSFGDPFTDEALMALPDWQYIPEKIKAPYMRSRERYWAQPVAREERLKFAQLRNTFVKRISDAGGRIMAGSDAPDLLMVYGWGLHRELGAYVRAGLTPYQALSAATRTPAEFLGAQREFGTLDVGKRADLVLIDGNPLSDIAAVGRIQGVMIGGKWLDRAHLDRLLAEGKRAIAGG